MDLLKRFYALFSAVLFAVSGMAFIGLAIENKSLWPLIGTLFFGSGAMYYGLIVKGAIASKSISSGPPPVLVPPEWLDREGKSEMKKLAEFYLKDMHKEILKDVTASNYATSVDKVDRVIKNIQRCSLRIEDDAYRPLIRLIGEKNKEELRRQELKLEQARIREQIREEQKVEREKQVKIKKMEDEEKSLEKALEIALRTTNDEHSAEIEKLRREIDDLRAKTEREKSNAQMTKAGNVYVISNIGSFGKNLYKIGMTRRSDPQDRIDELGDASVPFPFDVHMMIPCTDAPALENKLHMALEKFRYNKVNLRKEFFKVDLNVVVELVKSHDISPLVYEVPGADEYRESILLSEDAQGVGEEVA